MKKLLDFLINNFIIIGFLGVLGYSLYCTWTNPNYNYLESMRKINTTWEAGAILIGLAVLIVVFFNFKKWLIRDKIITDGKVCEVKYNSSEALIGEGSCSPSWSPTVEFYANGIRYEFKSGFGYRHISQGKKVSVVYDKNNPKRAEIYYPGITKIRISTLLFLVGLYWIIIDLFFL